MNRLSPRDFDVDARTLNAHRESSAQGLLITCAEECFPPEILEELLAPGAWIVHRSLGNIIPPCGAGHDAEEEIIDRAVEEMGIGTLVVCAHHPCSVAAQLLKAETSSDDLLLRAWLAHAEAARRCVHGLSGLEGARAAAVHNLLAQANNLRTHPAVAAALARGGLRQFAWLHDDELRCAGKEPTTFDRLVSLEPDQNRLLRRRPVAVGPNLPLLSPPYLA